MDTDNTVYLNAKEKDRITEILEKYAKDIEEKKTCIIYRSYAFTAIISKVNNDCYKYSITNKNYLAKEDL
jgi:hypothetical protein